jgi:hypothetical protein
MVAANLPGRTEEKMRGRQKKEVELVLAALRE